MLLPSINILFSPVEITPHNRQCVIDTMLIMNSYNATAGQGIKNAAIDQPEKPATGYL